MEGMGQCQQSNLSEVTQGSLYESALLKLNGVSHFIADTSVLDWILHKFTNSVVTIPVSKKKCVRRAFDELMQLDAHITCQLQAQAVPMKIAIEASLS